MTELAGQGLHGARPSRVRLARCDGPTRIVRAGIAARIDELAPVPGERATTVTNASGTVRVGTVEHLFAALGAEGLSAGVEITVEGDEIPLLDGGARAFVDALRALGLPRAAPRTRVVREATIVVGGAAYSFAPGAGPALAVEVEFDDARLAREARWDGDADDFRARVAPARTFGFAREVERLLDAGLASHVSPESVVVVRDDCILHSGAPFAADEPARHKLLDLVGDLFLHGGPPAGSVRAVRPGHAATHEAMRRARAEGVVSRAGE